MFWRIGQPDTIAYAIGILLAAGLISIGAYMHFVKANTLRSDANYSQTKEQQLVSQLPSRVPETINNQSAVASPEPTILPQKSESVVGQSQPQAEDSKQSSGVAKCSVYFERLNDANEKSRQRYEHSDKSKAAQEKYKKSLAQNYEQYKNDLPKTCNEGHDSDD